MAFPGEKGRFLLILACLATSAFLACGDSVAECPKQPPPQTPAPPRPVKVGKMSEVPKKAITVSRARKLLNHNGILQVAAVVLRDPQRSIKCLQNQHKHGGSCPPPYHIVADAPPFAKRPQQIRVRMLIKMVGPAPNLRRGTMYVFEGFWCPTKQIALFCTRAVSEISGAKGMEFWKRHYGSAAKTNPAGDPNGRGKARQSG
jgi:hypothetical protein